MFLPCRDDELEDRFEELPRRRSSFTRKRGAKSAGRRYLRLEQLVIERRRLQETAAPVLVQRGDFREDLMEEALQAMQDRGEIHRYYRSPFASVMNIRQGVDFQIVLAEPARRSVLRLDVTSANRIIEKMTAGRRAIAFPVWLDDTVEDVCGRLAHLIRHRAA